MRGRSKGLNLPMLAVVDITNNSSVQAGEGSWGGLHSPSRADVPRVWQGR
jgi:hypothetical protein